MRWVEKHSWSSDHQKNHDVVGTVESHETIVKRKWSASKKVLVKEAAEKREQRLDENDFEAISQEKAILTRKQTLI